MSTIICYGLLMVLLGYLLFPGLAAAAIPARERGALIALYNSTNGDGWSNNSGWKTPPLWLDGFAMPGTEGSWFGITLNAGETSVLRLELNANSLRGSIPPEVGNLTNLEWLFLSSNQLTGSIPPHLGSLRSLQYLMLFNNQLAGSIPPELGNLTNLEYLYLYSNQLTGSIPPELGNLTNLQSLGLSNNHLDASIPPVLGNLSTLQYLDLHDNQLTGSIPPELGNLTNLQSLGLSNNQLSASIPLQLMNLTNLVKHASDFRWNHLFTTHDTLRAFLNSKQIGEDWESYQTRPFTSTMPLDTLAIT